ncbi:methylenetetrahydrofolate reductase isoform X2 [Venturia canescens]|uniref:methylenetetrahydrofolate reductase isoform X2 n=1 Tax=Venturia canescens TaxID=32260 RepID=UPI001C9D4FBF|nr:methylenetetrahydrofolate reductase isoform X2 [Venturia canescens]
MDDLVSDNKFHKKKITSHSSLFSKLEENENLTICEKATSAERKIVNVAQLIDTKLCKKEKFFSLEILLNKKYNDDLYKRFLLEISGIHPRPLFFTTAWREGYSSGINSTYSPLEMLRILPSTTLLHMLANDLKESEVRKILDDALVRGVTNIFVLRGDNCTGNGDFSHAIDLVKFIKKNYENKFVICVAGYPEMHPQSESKEMDLVHLKKKVDAGASFIITQIFLESKVFVNFVEDCRKFGINVPIIPGIFAITNSKCITGLAKSCNLKIPQSVIEDIKSMKDNEEGIYEYGIELAAQLITDIFRSQAANGFHLFTLNRASVAWDVCKRIWNDGKDGDK